MKLQIKSILFFLLVLSCVSCVQEAQESSENKEESQESIIDKGKNLFDSGLDYVTNEIEEAEEYILSESASLLQARVFEYLKTQPQIKYDEEAITKVLSKADPVRVLDAMSLGPDEFADFVLMIVLNSKLAHI